MTAVTITIERDVTSQVIKITKIVQNLLVNSYICPGRDLLINVMIFDLASDINSYPCKMLLNANTGY